MKQITMFEPSGSELCTLAASTFNHAEQLDKQAQNLDIRGFIAAARSYHQKASEAFLTAFTFEMAAQFETEAGLL